LPDLIIANQWWALAILRIGASSSSGDLFPLAVANIYCDLADAIRGETRDGLPNASDGVRSMAAVHAAVASARSNGAWLDARPPIFR